jgi:hypothetical protein
MFCTPAAADPFPIPTVHGKAFPLSDGWAYEVRYRIIAPDARPVWKVFKDYYRSRVANQAGFTFSEQDNGIEIVSKRSGDPWRRARVLFGTVGGRGRGVEHVFIQLDRIQWSQPMTDAGLMQLWVFEGSVDLE